MCAGIQSSGTAAQCKQPLLRIFIYLQIPPKQSGLDGDFLFIASHSMFEITFGSWISLTTSASWLSLHRTRRARPKEPSPITFCTEYFSIRLVYQPQEEATVNKKRQYQHKGGWGRGCYCENIIFYCVISQ